MNYLLLQYNETRSQSKEKGKKTLSIKKKNGGNTFSASEIQRIEEISNI